MKSGTEYTTQRAEWFGLDPQRPDETEIKFKERISSALREKGHIIEAHEACHNQLYDDASGGEMSPRTGIMGAMAQQLYGRSYSQNGANQIGDDIAVGTIVNNPRPEMSPEMALIAILLDDATRRK